MAGRPNRRIPSTLVAFGLALLLAAPPAGAQAYPSILGTFTGTLTETDTGCADPNDNGTFTLQLTLVFDDQVGGDFTGTGATNDGDAVQISGIIQPDGSISAGFYSVNPDGTESSGSITGTLSGNTLSLSYSGSDVVGDTCIFSGSGTLSRSGTGTVVPDIAPPTAVTTPDLLNDSMRTINEALTTRIFNFLHQRGTGPARVTGGLQLGATGMAAGEHGGLPVGVWGSYTRTDAENDFSSTAYDSAMNLFMGGVDVAPSEEVVVGLAVGYENTDVDTKFNAGKQDLTAWTVAPYAGVLINDTFSLDASFGYSSVSNDQYRTSPVTGLPITSDVDSNRMFASGNVTGSRYFGDFLASGFGGLLWARESLDAFTESDGTAYSGTRYNLGQIRFGGEVAWAAHAFEPFANAAYRYDFQRTPVNFATGVPVPNDDRDDVRLGLGVRYFGSQGLSGVFEYSTILGRDNYSDDTFNFTLRWEF